MSNSVRPLRTASVSLRVSSCSLAVDDLDQALAVYRDMLGFEMNGDVTSQEVPCQAVGARAFLRRPTARRPG